MANNTLWAAVVLSMLTVVGITAAAQADWKQIGTFGGGQNTVWADGGKVQTHGTDKNVLEMRDYGAAQTDYAALGVAAYLSDVSVIQIDCGGKTVSTISTKLYDGHMGQGKVLYKDAFPPSQRSAHVIVAGSISSPSNSSFVDSRGQAMKLHHTFVAAMALVFLASPALADACGDAEMNLLEGKGSQDAVMSACTAAIQSGSTATQDLADDYHFRGEVYEARNDDTNALADYDQTVKIDPMHNDDLIYKRAQFFGMSGNFDRAIAYYSDAIKMQPDYADAFTGRALAYREKGNHVSAIADLDQAIRYHPTDYVAYAERGYERGMANTGLDLAAADCSKSLSLTDNIDGHHCAGLVALRAGRFDQAIAKYNAAVALAKRDKDPIDSETLYGLGIAELRKGNKSGRAQIAKAEKAWPGVNGRTSRAWGSRRNACSAIAHGAQISNGAGNVGGRCRTRTCDPLIKSQLLYRLS